MLKSIFITILAVLSFTACGQNSNKQQIKKSMEYNKLTEFEEWVIENKGTERPFTGKYDQHFETGVYTCKKCDAPLYKSDDKFSAHCGWPAFDDEIEGAVTRKTDADGRRTEILCSNCGGHLGHVFEGEKLTDKNVRHCVNSVSLNFVPKVEKTNRAIFASGCFWGTEYYMSQAKGVLSTTVGYIGGHVENPTYKQVCTGTTGHAEAVEVVFDPTKTNFETLCRLFFETHDPTQIDRQGPDIGKQYRSGVFYLDDEQKEITEKLVKELQNKGLIIATEVTKATEFYEGEDYHQDYYFNRAGTPYCHKYTKRF